MSLVVATWKRKSLFLLAIVDNNLEKAGRFFVPVAAIAV